MANKYDVLARIKAGMTPKVIAAELGCSPEYVRATRRRATAYGKELSKEWSNNRYARQKAKQEAIRREAPCPPG
jgi:predicted transcriptional regulator